MHNVFVRLYNTTEKRENQEEIVKKISLICEKATPHGARLKKPRGACIMKGGKERKKGDAR
ncbi:hypothetical protein [uncultured Anaerotruncus sp.]|uniref:hypothetical protein n=1 Tax=uncultured Anaerotruncus sp. TaxID=905011 RepID=UPI00280BC662|nr:hypothetical protein [uncultured Anaerotruncus sp.]